MDLTNLNITDHARGVDCDECSQFYLNAYLKYDGHQGPIASFAVTHDYAYFRHDEGAALDALGAYLEAVGYTQEDLENVRLYREMGPAWWREVAEIQGSAPRMLHDADRPQPVGAR